MVTRLQSRSWLEFSLSFGSCWALLSWRSSWRTSPLHLQLFLCSWNQLTLSVSRFVQIFLVVTVVAVISCYPIQTRWRTRKDVYIDFNFLVFCLGESACKCVVSLRSLGLPYFLLSRKCHCIKCNIHDTCVTELAYAPYYRNITRDIGSAKPTTFTSATSSSFHSIFYSCL